MAFIEHVPDEDPCTRPSRHSGTATAFKGLGAVKRTNNPGEEGESFLNKIFTEEREVEVEGGV